MQKLMLVVCALFIGFLLGEIIEGRRIVDSCAKDERATVSYSLLDCNLRGK